MGTLWDPFGWFLEVLGAILGDEKIVAKIGWQKVTRRTPGAPERSRELPLFSLLGLPNPKQKVP